MTDLTLDRIDRKILFELMQDATVSGAELAARVGLSQTPCWKRVQKLEAAGVIIGRVALVNPAAIGLALTVFVEIEAMDHSTGWREHFARLITRFPAIVEAHRMSGAIDYLLKVVVADAAAYDAFYLEFTGQIACRRFSSRFSMERMQMTTALPIDFDCP